MRFQGPLPNTLGATHGRGGREAHCARVLSGPRVKVQWRRPANQRGWGRGFAAALPGRPRATSGNKPAARGRGLVGRRRRAAPRVGTGIRGTAGKDRERQTHVRASRGDGAPGEVRGGRWACARHCVTSAPPRPRLGRRPRRGGLSVTPAERPLLSAVFRTPPVPRPGALPSPRPPACPSARALCPRPPRAPAARGHLPGATRLPAAARSLPSLRGPSPAAPVSFSAACPACSLQTTVLSFASSPSL